jgi:protein TonB
MWKVVFCLLLAVSATSVAEDKLSRVEPDVASRNLTKKVEPTIPPLAKAVGVGGTVVLDIVIDPAGKVVSVNVISGHPMLAPAFIEAVRKWEYTPFEKDGKAVSVVTRVEWVPDSPKYSKPQEKAIRDYYPVFQSCYGLLKEGKDIEAEKKCGELLPIAEQLPENRILERSDARLYLAHSLYRQHRFEESIPLYEKAVEIRKTHEKSDSDADFASENASLARAYAAVWRTSESDNYYSQAVTIYKAAIVNLPSMKDNYTARLKNTLREYAKLKTALGQKEEAAALEKEMAEL